MGERTCLRCGGAMEHRRSNAKYCCRECTTAAMNAKHKPAHAPQACTWCGQVFTPQRQGRIYCSPRCNNEQRLVAVRRGEISSRHQLLSLRRCLTCNTDLTNRNGSARYCPQCKEQRLPIWRATAQLKKPLHMTCKGCSKQFGHPQTSQYCTLACMGRYGQAKQVGEYHRTCLACGIAYVSHDKRRMTCSQACKQWSRNFPGVQRLRVGECEYCSQPFTAHRGDQRFCSSQCGKRPSDARRRAAKRGAYVEDVSTGVVAARDKWRCRLCGKKVNKSLRHPHPMAQSLDHVIPISRGGEHSYANTQLVHLICNVRKGNKTRKPEQLSLVG